MGELKRSPRSLILYLREPLRGKGRERERREERQGRGKGKSREGGQREGRERGAWGWEGSK